jgi:hypothetical protein
MPGFYVTGTLEPSRHGRSFKVYRLVDGKKVFIGLIKPQALTALLRREIAFVDICQFQENPGVEQEPISFFSVNLRKEAKH